MFMLTVHKTSGGTLNLQEQILSLQDSLTTDSRIITVSL